MDNLPMNQPPSPAELQVARLEASCSNVAFAARRASDALADFAFTAALALGDAPAVRATDAAKDAIGKASGNPPP